MSAADPILTALTRMEERLLERIDDRFRELQLDLDGRFDAVHVRLDRLEQGRVQELEGRLPPE